MALEHLRFFNKQGSEITPELEDGIFKLNLYFKKVSTNSGVISLPCLLKNLKCSNAINF